MRSISKVFVAAAVAGACGYASAAVITVETPTYSANNAIALESFQAAGAADATALGTVNVLLGGPYSLNDQIELSVSGAGFGSSALQSASFTCQNGADSGNSTVFSLVTASSTSSTLIYAASAPAGLTAGQSCQIPTVQITAGSVTAAGKISLSSVSKKAATLASFDTGASATVASVASVYSITSSTILDGVIDVQNDRLTFASNDNGLDLLDGDDDAFAISLNVASTHTMVTSVTGSMVITLTAGTSFGFLAEPGASLASCDISGTGASTAIGVGVAADVHSVNTACTVMTVNIPTVAAGLYSIGLGRSTLTPTLATSTAFVEQSYTASATASIAGSRVTTKTATPAAGAWTINGTTVHIPYLPRNANIDLIVNISNLSTQTGEVTFTAYNANGTACTGSLGNVGARSNMSVGGALKTALLGCTGTGWDTATRASVQLVSPTPNASTRVNSSFSTTDGKSRQIVINSQN